MAQPRLRCVAYNRNDKRDHSSRRTAKHSPRLIANDISWKKIFRMNSQLGEEIDFPPRVSSWIAIRQLFFPLLSQILVCLWISRGRVRRRRSWLKRYPLGRVCVSMIRPFLSSWFLLSFEFALEMFSRCFARDGFATRLFNQPDDQDDCCVYLWETLELENYIECARCGKI